MKIFLIGNWKLNPETLAKAKKLFNEIEKEFKKFPKVFKKEKIVLCPPFLYLSEIRNLILKSKLKIDLGAQNCFFEEKGAFTGEISPKMLKSLKVKFVILGHSERRRIFGESDEMIQKKVLAVLKEKLTPILCIGETEKQRKAGKTFEVLKNQLKKSLKNLLNFESQTAKIILAYEPVWAIGTKNPCHPKDAKEVLLFLRKFLKKSPILYGGSVDSKNAKEYIEVGYEGLLVGGASLKAKEFVKIAKFISSLT